METKIGYTIAAYFGKRNYSHYQYKNDMLFYVRIQLAKIDNSNIIPYKIYIICTFDTIVDKEKILSELYKLKNNRTNIVIVTRGNTGGSYCSWHSVLQLDNNQCDYMILTEDDYVIYNSDAISELLKYFNKYSELFYITMYWTHKPYKTLSNLIVQCHAAISPGMINVKMYQKLKQDYNLDFQLVYNPAENYISMWENQALFLEPYRKNGVLIMDITQEHSVIFSSDTNGTIEYGNPNGTLVFLPIMNKYFKA